MTHITRYHSHMVAERGEMPRSESQSLAATDRERKVQDTDKTVGVAIVKQVEIPTVEVLRAQFPDEVTDDSMLIPGTFAQPELYRGEDGKFERRTCPNQRLECCRESVDVGLGEVFSR